VCRKEGQICAISVLMYVKEGWIDHNKPFVLVTQYADTVRSTVTLTSMYGKSPRPTPWRKTMGGVPGATPTEEVPGK